MSTRVLIVDDSPDVQVSLSALLTAEPGIEVIGCAEDRASALALVEQRAPDVVVLDIDLANRDRGFDVLRDIHRQHPDLAIVMLSNYGWSSMRPAFIDAGALAYFDKALEFGRAIEWICARARTAPGSARWRNSASDFDASP